MSKKTEKSESPAASQELTFEEALAQLESVVRDLEDGHLGLNDSLLRYEDGVRILRYCHGALNEAERKILLLTAVEESGAAIVEPYDDRAMSLEEKREHRTRRRSSNGASGRSGPEGHAGLTGSSDSGSATDEPCDVDRQKGLF